MHKFLGIIKFQIIWELTGNEKWIPSGFVNYLYCSWRCWGQWEKRINEVTPNGKINVQREKVWIRKNKGAKSLQGCEKTMPKCQTRLLFQELHAISCTHIFSIVFPGHLLWILIIVTRKNFILYFKISFILNLRNKYIMILN